MILNDQMTSIIHNCPLQLLYDPQYIENQTLFCFYLLVRTLVISGLNQKAAAGLAFTLQNVFVLLSNLASCACRDTSRVFLGLRCIKKKPALDTYKTRSNNTTLLISSLSPQISRKQHWILISLHAGLLLWYQ